MMQTRQKARGISTLAVDAILKPSLAANVKKSTPRATARKVMVDKQSLMAEVTETLKIPGTSAKRVRAVKSEVVVTQVVGTGKTTKRSTGTSISSTASTTTTTTASIPQVTTGDAPFLKTRFVPDYAPRALAHLTRADPNLASLISRVPYEIYKDADDNYFRVLCRTIIGQQVHWKAARSIIFRFVSFYFPTHPDLTMEALDSGYQLFPTPESVLGTSLEDLRSCGLSERKASYIQDLAKHFAEGKITFVDPKILKEMTDQEIFEQLIQVRGIGPWTVDMFLMNTLQRLDVLPTLDLGVRNGMQKHFKDWYRNGSWQDHDGLLQARNDVDGNHSQELSLSQEVAVDKKKSTKSKSNGKGSSKKGEMSCDDMERMAEHWRPYRSIAAWYMWRMADDGKITAPLE